MKTAIVTGATSGIGFEICKVLLERDFKVYGFGRDFSKVSINNENFIPCEFDLTEINKLVAKINKLRKQESNISCLVNCAGVGYFGPHEELNYKKISEMIVVNLEVPMVLSQLLLRDLKKNSGSIINISSVTANKSNTHGCAYGATKAGLSNFSRSLFDEVRKYGVKVLAIHPDMTRTNFYRNSNFCEDSSLDAHLLPGDVANLVDLFLEQRDGIVLSEVTIKPQIHRIKRKKN